MALQFIIGSSGSGKSDTAYRKMIDLSLREEQERRNFLILVPEQFTLQTQKALVEMHPHHGIMKIDVLSFLRLAYRVFDEIGAEDRLVLEDVGKSIIVKKVMMDHKAELKVYGANIRKVGFVDEMKSLLSEFYQYHISPEDLEEAGKHMGNRVALNNKMADIRLVYRAFRDFLKERYITAEEVLEVLAQCLDSSALVRDAVICLDGFTGFTPSQYQLLSALLRNAKKVYLTVTMDAKQAFIPQKEHQIFYLSYKTMEKLKELAEQEGVLVETPVLLAEKGIPVRFQDSIPLAVLERNLFRYPAMVYEKEQDDIQIRSLEDQEAEVLFAASEILRLVREEGYRYQDIAIVCGDTATYGRMLREIFEKASIPCFVDDKKDVLQNPFVEFLRAGLEMAAKDFSYESVFRYLRSGMTDWRADEIDLLEEYVLALGIRGYSMWKKEWTRTYRTKRPVLLETVNALRSRLVEEVTPLYTVLTDKTQTVLAFTSALYGYGASHRCEEKLRRLAKNYKEENDLTAAKEYEQIYRVVMDLFDRVAELLGRDVLPLAEYAELMEAGFAEGEVGLIPQRTDQVVAGDTERTRLNDIKVLFFLGANDGLIPKKEDGGGILSDAEREWLKQTGMELAPTKRQSAYTGQFYLYLCLTKPSRKLYVTYARLGEDGKTMRASYLIGKLCGIFPGLSIRQEDDTVAARIAGDRGYQALKEGLRKVADQSGTAGFSGTDLAFFWELYRFWYRSGKEGKEKLDRLVEAAFYPGRSEGIDAKNAVLLYGRLLAGSVTRLEQYAACAFAHFLHYGLELEERPEYKIGMPDIGTIFHSALQLFSERLQESEYNWHTLPEALRETWGSESVKAAAKEFGGGILADTRRNAYLVTRVDRILKRALSVLTEQLRSGKFEPEAYEMAFRYADRYLSLRGRIDRLDVYREQDILYLKVIDYKSGSTSFDMGLLYYGLQLQLGVYLNAVTQLRGEREVFENPKNRSGETDMHGNPRIIPAGIFYFHLNDPLVEKGPDAEAALKKALRMDGIANKDPHILGLLDRSLVSGDDTLVAGAKSNVIPVEIGKSGDLLARSNVADTEEFQRILEYVNDKMASFSKAVMEGDTDVSPYRIGKKTACDHCAYRGVCGFDCKMPWDSYRELKKISEDEARIKIAESVQERKGAAHGKGNMDG